ncbi:hypothetical protein AMELA_G00181710 [Ameiurus melas]|uniref:Uncharacterized protein n=1 Tax=Ameiurus melas TaxID=219545 RepID=A0A7J6AAE3_AMEME|nr:hypothetical protein AMELA_G00181710 [Ameiurus melas]
MHTVSCMLREPDGGALWASRLRKEGLRRGSNKMTQTSVSNWKGEKISQIIATYLLKQMSGPLYSLLLPLPRAWAKQQQRFEKVEFVDFEKENISRL